MSAEQANGTRNTRASQEAGPWLLPRPERVPFPEDHLDFLDHPWAAAWVTWCATGSYPVMPDFPSTPFQIAAAYALHVHDRGWDSYVIHLNIDDSYPGYHAITCVTPHEGPNRGRPIYVDFTARQWAWHPDTCNHPQLAGTVNTGITQPLTPGHLRSPLCWRGSPRKPPIPGLEFTMEGRVGPGWEQLDPWAQPHTPNGGIVPPP